MKHTLSFWVLKLFYSNYLWKWRQHTLGSTIWITLLDWNVVVVFNRWRQQDNTTRIPKRRLPTCLHAKHITSTCLHTLRRMNRLSNRYKRVNYGWSITSLEWSVVGVRIAVDCIQLNFRSFHHRLHSTTHTGISRGETLPGSTR